MHNVLILEITVAIGLCLFVFYLGYYILMWMKSRGWKSLYNPSLEEYTPSVSIVVPTYNEEDTIVRKLRNLIKQDYPSVEIIVVDSASEDRTRELVEMFVKDNDLDVKLIREEERRGKASALNEASKCCTGEIVVTTDADAIWEKDTLRKAVSNFSDPNIGAVTGRQILLNPNQSLETKVEKTYRRFYEVLRVGESTIDSTPIFHGELTCLRRSLIENVNEDSMADDSELAVKVRKKGFRSIHDPNAVFYEYAPSTFKYSFVQKLRRGQGLIQLFWRERGILLNRKYGKFGVVIFPADFFMHLVSPIFVFAFLISFLYGLLLMDNYLLISLIVAMMVSFVALTIMKINVLSFVLTFLNFQFILLLSLIYHVLGKSQHKWRKVSETRELWRKSAYDT